MSDRGTDSTLSPSFIVSRALFHLLLALRSRPRKIAIEPSSCNLLSTCLAQRCLFPRGVFISLSWKRRVSPGSLQFVAIKIAGFYHHGDLIPRSFGDTPRYIYMYIHMRVERMEQPCPRGTRGPHNAGTTIAAVTGSIPRDAQSDEFRIRQGGRACAPPYV